MRFAPLRATSALVIPWLIFGCDREPEVPATVAPPGVVATYAGGEVTEQEIDELLVAMTRSGIETPRTVEWYTELIEELVVDRLIAREAELVGVLEDPAFIAFHDATQRRVLADAYESRHLARPAPITDAELREHYDQHRDEWTRQNSRLVEHIFLRRETGTDLDDLEIEALELRERVLRGERFGALARERSDSESRHRDGLLGWIERGTFPAEVEAIIFELPEFTPSRPIRAAEGVHLFNVRSVFEEKQYTFEEVAVGIRQRLERERLEEARRSLLESVPLPPGSFVPTPDELTSLLQGGDARSVVLRIGDFELLAGQLRELVEQARSGAERPTLEVERSVLASIERRERLYLRALADGIADEATITERLDHLRRRDLVSFFRTQELERRASTDLNALEAFYRDNATRFSGPLVLELRRLSITRPDTHGNRLMAELERVRPELDDGSTSLEDLAERLGGTIEDLGWISARELASIAPPAAREATTLESGRHTAPYSDPTAINVLQVTQRREPASPPPFSTIVDQVRAEFLSANGQRLYDRWAEELLENSRFELLESRLPHVDTSEDST